MTNPNPVKQIINLNDNWKFKQHDKENWLPAKVPGSVHTDLLENKIIDDPFYRMNEKDQQWIGYENWIYEKKFDYARTKLKGAIQKAGEEEPWLYKAKILEGNIFLAIGRGKINYDESLKDFSRAEEAYRQVIKIGKSDMKLSLLR